MKKILIALAALFVIVAVAAYFYLHKGKLKAFEPEIKEKLNKLVMDASNGLYHLEIEKLEADVINSRISIINAHLIPDTLVYAKMEKDSTAPDDVFDVTVKQLSLDQIASSDFISDKSINLRRLFINNPVVIVSHKKQSYNVPDKDSAKSIYEKIKKDLSSIHLDTIIVDNINFIYRNNNRKNKETRLSNVKFFMSDVLIDSSTQIDKSRFFFARNCLISLKNHVIYTADSLYRFNIGAVEIETNNQLVNLKKLQFVPRVSVQNFYKRIKHQQDRFEITIDEVNFSRINWWSLLEEESFLLQKIRLKNGLIKVYNDKSQPIDTRSKAGKYPHQLLMKLPFIIKIDTLAVTNLALSYTELNPKTGETGNIRFNNIQGIMTNITNDPEQIKKNHFINISAKALFMNKTPLTAAFAFDLNKYKNGNFSVIASVGQMEAETINAITIPLGMLKVNSLHMKSLDVSIKGDNVQGTGTVKMIYDGLNVTALKNSGDTLKKRGLLSFIANTFVIKKQNPVNNRPPRIETAAFKRDIHKSFFNLVWKTVFTGAGKTVGYKVKK